MNVRFWCAIGWGVVGFFATISALWTFTMLDIFGVMFYGMIVYLVVIGAILWITEPPKKKAEPKWNPDDCPIQTLDRGEWNDHTR